MELDIGVRFSTTHWLGYNSIDSLPMNDFTLITICGCKDYIC